MNSDLLWVLGVSALWIGGWYVLLLITGNI